MKKKPAKRRNFKSCLTSSCFYDRDSYGFFYCWRLKWRLLLLLLGQLKCDCVLGESQKADDKLTRFAIIYWNGYRIVRQSSCNFYEQISTSNQPRTSESLEDRPQDSSSGIGWPWKKVFAIHWLMLHALSREWERWTGTRLNEFPWTVSSNSFSLGI